MSIVVLPFANLNNDPEQQYFADAVTEDLTTDLSRLTNMFVISRNTAFTYKDKPVNAKQIGSELGVRYVLEGSVRRSGNQVRINTQLIDAATGAHLWAERFDRDASDLFALQNEITSRIAVALNLELVAAEAARPNDNPDALDYILRGRAARSKLPTREGYAKSIGLYERALALDPSSIDAQSELAAGLAGRVLDGKSDAPAEDLGRAEALLAPALAASQRSPFLHFIKGQVLRARAQGPFALDGNARTSLFADAVPEYEIALAANPNNVSALAHLAWCKVMTGGGEEAIPLLEKAVRLSPRDPFLYLWSNRIGVAHLLQSRTDDAIVWLEKSRRANPGFPITRFFLAAAYGLKGETDRAAAELPEALRLTGNDRFSTIARVRINSTFNSPILHDRFENTYVAGLRKAGMPEE
jgi:adenylate cyclase